MPEFGWCRSLTLGQDPEIRLAPNPSCPGVCPCLCPMCPVADQLRYPSREAERGCFTWLWLLRGRDQEGQEGGGAQCGAPQLGRWPCSFPTITICRCIIYNCLPRVPGRLACWIGIQFFHLYPSVSPQIGHIILCPCLYASLASPATTTHCSSQASSDGTHHQSGSRPRPRPRPRPRRSYPTPIATPPSSLVNFSSQSFLDCSNPATLLSPGSRPHKLSTALSALLGHKI